jgi:hypothetical protein
MKNAEKMVGKEVLVDGAVGVVVAYELRWAACFDNFVVLMADGGYRYPLVSDVVAV